MSASIRRQGVIGLLAGLTLPIGAALQMILLPPGAGGPMVSFATNWARVIVWAAAAAVGAGVVVTRFLAARSDA